MSRTYLCIDLKTFYASCECAERNLDPFTTNLVVADPSRGKGTICLAISPAMKKLGIKNRCRLFEIPSDVKYIMAPPRMALYIEKSADVYSIYLRYISKDDIHVYSIDEAFLDVTDYLTLYNMTAFELAKKIMDDIYKELKLTATAGIGTNLFLAKVALDITAKHVSTNIGYLDEEKFVKELSLHTPLTDFWQIGRGIARRLNKLGIYTLKDLREKDEKILYKEFGVNALFLIHHAKGEESCTIKDIKRYKSASHSLSQGQVLFEDYEYDKALVVVKEMVDLLSLDMVDKHVVSNSLFLYIGYSKNEYPATGGSLQISERTNVYSILLKHFVDLYKKTTNPFYKIRRINIGVGDVKSEEYEELGLLIDEDKVKKERELEKAINSIKKEFGKNSILKGINFVEGATTRKRNKLIGGHRSGEED